MNADAARRTLLAAEVEGGGETTLRRIRRTHGAFEADELLEHEWLVTNAIGGYASGTLAGVPTRRYHGILIAALPVHGRTVMLSHLTEHVGLDDGRSFRLGGEERDGTLGLDLGPLVEFRLELGMPVWTYDCGGTVIEKSIFMAHGHNSAHVVYRLVGGTRTAELRLHPAIAFRPHDAPLSTHGVRDCVLTTSGAGRYAIEAEDLPALRLAIFGHAQRFTIDWSTADVLHYRVEAHRGYGANQAVLRPGALHAVLAPGTPVLALIASTESWNAIDAQAPAEALEAERERRRRVVRQVPAAQDATVAELVLAADAFIVTPGWRVHDLARGRAAGLHYRSVIAGYHWFTDWGRDTMIGLEGLTLATGRQNEAHDILWMFAEHVRDGLIPNLFPEGCEEGLYHTADATLWFFHALDRYATLTGDAALVRQLLPTLRVIVAAHLAGTRFGIGVDPLDGLLRQGEAGYQLTWMDAKVGDWVVTPRRGKAVEINALWYNALRLLADWLRGVGEDGGAATDIDYHAERARHAFNARFWNAAQSCLYDVVDGENGDDAACRPNQVFAISLRHPILARERWGAVMEVVRERLLTPFGLRSLAPGHPDYKPRYFGDLKARDAAYHQGTVWAWLIGPYLDAWRKLNPGDAAGARVMLEGLAGHLGAAGVGSISEVFDAEAPFTPRGCIAQAWSVAEVLRCWLALAE
jgi:predicted glycogen debranching enzyme